MILVICAIDMNSPLSLSVNLKDQMKLVVSSMEDLLQLSPSATEREIEFQQNGEQTHFIPRLFQFNKITNQLTFINSKVEWQFSFPSCSLLPRSIVLMRQHLYYWLYHSEIISFLMKEQTCKGWQLRIYAREFLSDYLSGQILVSTPFVDCCASYIARIQFWLSSLSTSLTYYERQIFRKYDEKNIIVNMSICRFYQNVQNEKLFLNKQALVQKISIKKD